MHRKSRGPALCIVRISTVSIKLEELYGPNPAGISYPPTSDIPLPLPFKTLDPWLGSRVLKGKGIGQHEDTPGLPLLITSWVASLVSSSALSLPWILQWLGHHVISTVTVEELHHPAVKLGHIVLTWLWFSVEYGPSYCCIVHKVQNFGNFQMTCDEPCCLFCTHH